MTTIARATCLIVVLAYFVLVAIFVSSAPRFLDHFLVRNESLALAYVRTALHCVFSPGGVSALFALLALFRGHGLLMAAAIGAAFLANLALSYMFSGVFGLWLLIQLAEGASLYFLFLRLQS